VSCARAHFDEAAGLPPPCVADTQLLQKVLRVRKENFETPAPDALAMRGQLVPPGRSWAAVSAGHSVCSSLLLRVAESSGVRRW